MEKIQPRKTLSQVVLIKVMKNTVILLVLFLSLNAFGQEKLALVIGNQSYKAGPLRNPINDARAMSEMLKSKLGFEVIELHDAKLEEMTQQFRLFVSKVKDGGTALVYFAGHGAQYEERNYLFPVNIDAVYAEDLTYAALPLQRILDKLNRKNKNGANLILLDSCRNNPLMRKERSYMRGLAEVKLHPNSYVAYATLPNGVASDNPQASNGLFTQSLLKYMPVENTNLDTMIRNVRNDVHKISGGRQIPYGINLLTEEFCLNGCPSSHRPEEPKLNQFLQAFAQLEPLAEQGNINAQFELGNLYSNKNTPNYDIEKAILWYSKAANQGSGYAQNNLGRIYSSVTKKGEFPGAKFNDELAFYWMLKAAQQNIPLSQGVVSGMYAFGVGVEKDYKKSFMWVKRAADSGYTVAQNVLGDFYREGKIDLRKDYIKAFDWYRRAAIKGDISGQLQLAILLGKGGHGLKIDHKLSSYWYKQAATGGNASAQVLLGYNYCAGRGVTRNFQQCANWLSKGYDNPSATQQEKDYAVSLWEEYNLEKVAQ